MPAAASHMPQRSQGQRREQHRPGTELSGLAPLERHLRLPKSACQAICSICDPTTDADLTVASTKMGDWETKMGGWEMQMGTGRFPPRRSRASRGAEVACRGQGPATYGLAPLTDTLDERCRRRGCHGSRGASTRSRARRTLSRGAWRRPAWVRVKGEGEGEGWG